MVKICGDEAADFVSLTAASSSGTETRPPVGTVAESVSPEPDAAGNDCAFNCHFCSFRGW